MKIMAKEHNIEDAMPKKHYEPQWKSCRFPERPANAGSGPLVLDFTNLALPPSLRSLSERLKSSWPLLDEDDDGQTAPEGS